MDRLADFGAVPVAERVVADGEYVTAAGMDMAPTLGGTLRRHGCQPTSAGGGQPMSRAGVPHSRCDSVPEVRSPFPGPRSSS